MNECINSMHQNFMITLNQPQLYLKLYQNSRALRYLRFVVVVKSWVHKPEHSINLLQKGNLQGHFSVDLLVFHQGTCQSLLGKNGLSNTGIASENKLRLRPNSFSYLLGH